MAKSIGKRSVRNWAVPVQHSCLEAVGRRLRLRLLRAGLLGCIEVKGHLASIPAPPYPEVWVMRLLQCSVCVTAARSEGLRRTTARLFMALLIRTMEARGETEAWHGLSR